MSIRELLTERQYQILQLIAQKKTNKKIAQQLGLSIHTVDTHVLNIYSRLEIDERPKRKEAREMYLKEVE